MQDYTFSLQEQCSLLISVLFYTFCNSNNYSTIFLKISNHFNVLAFEVAIVNIINQVFFSQ